MSLSPKQLLAARLAAQGKSGGQIATACGVRPETVSRWRKLPAWVRAVDEAVGDGGATLSAELADYNGAVAALVWKALDVLDREMSCCDEKIRVSAAATVLRLLGAQPPAVEIDVEIRE
jgi:hypothetical protein